jgi:hypothetical protein
VTERSTARHPDGVAAASAVVSRASRPWRRQLGALAWAALEELALNAPPDDHGWASVVGVRALAVDIGTTEDAALRALAALTRAGLVAIESVTDADGGGRCGYRLHLPDGIALRCCLVDEDAAQQVPVRGASDRDASSLRTNSDPRNGRGPQHCPTDRDRWAVTQPPDPEKRCPSRGPKEQP